MKGLKQYAVATAQNTLRRLLVRAGVTLVLFGGSYAYYTIKGETAQDEAEIAARQAERDSARKVAIAAKVAADTARRVEMQSKGAVAPAPATAPAAGPQIGIPDINNAKRKAQNAADATNRNLAEQTGQELPSRGAPAPAAPAPKSGPGSVKAVPSATPATPAALTNVSQVTREVFNYSADGRRDPFYSLILTEDLRPLLSDLKLVGILYEPSGRRSVAIMRDIQTNAQYRVLTGQTLGRMRVTQIRPKGVIFTIDEFGLSRQDSLVLTDTTKVRN